MYKKFVVVRVVRGKNSSILTPPVHAFRGKFFVNIDINLFLLLEKNIKKLQYLYIK